MKLAVWWIEKLSVEGNQERRCEVTVFHDVWSTLIPPPPMIPPPPSCQLTSCDVSTHCFHAVKEAAQVAILVYHLLSRHFKAWSGAYWGTLQSDGSQSDCDQLHSLEPQKRHNNFKTLIAVRFENLHRGYCTALCLPSLVFRQKIGSACVKSSANHGNVAQVQRCYKFRNTDAVAVMLDITK